MEEVGHRVNLDFEDSLFDENYQKEKRAYLNQCKEFEYLYLWNGDIEIPLINLNEYEKSFLDHVKNFRGETPAFTKKENVKKVKMWWGDSTSSETKMLNSKLYSTELGIENNWAHAETKIIHTLNELERSVLESKYDKFLLRSPFKFSGMGHLYIDRNNWNSDRVVNALKESALTFDPLLQRVSDFGLTLRKDGSSFVVENLIDKKGQFKGSIYSSKLPESESIVNDSKKITDYLLSKDWNETIEIDSFYYLNGGELGFYPLVEINYRKTMGLMTYLFSQSFSKASDKYTIWLLHPKKSFEEIKSFDDLLDKVGKRIYSPERRCGVLPTSPIENKFWSFLIIDTTLKQAQHQIVELWKLLAKKGETLPLEYVVYT
jgi:hypothetical protein